MKKESLVCIICPKECDLIIELDNNEIKNITGNKCNRGLTYANKEFTNPERELATTVFIKEGILPLLPVRTNKPLPKNSLIKVMSVISETEVIAPVKKGDIIIKDVLNLGVDIIASRSIHKK